MKYLLIILLFVSSNLFSNEARIKRLQKVAKVESENDILKKLLERNRKLNSLLQRTKDVDPVIWQRKRKLLTGVTLRGILLNSIRSTNLSSPVLVKAYSGQGLSLGTKFSCHGVTKNKRVLTLCNKMISNGMEKPVQVQILNMDGTSGLMGYYDDNKEDLIAGAVISDFAQGVLSATQSRVDSIYGSTLKNTAQNEIYSGLIKSGKTTSNILMDEMKTAEPIVTINAGKEVLIYFMEGINES